MSPNDSLDHRSVDFRLIRYHREGPQTTEDFKLLRAGIVGTVTEKIAASVTGS